MEGEVQTFYILRAMKIVQTFSRPKQGNSAGAHAPYFRTLRSITGGKASTTHRHSAPCTLFTDCNAPTNYCYLWLISSNTVSLLIKVSGVRISDGSPKEKVLKSLCINGFKAFFISISMLPIQSRIYCKPTDALLHFQIA